MVLTVTLSATSTMIFMSFSSIQYIKALVTDVAPKHQGTLIGDSNWRSVGLNIMESIRRSFFGQAYVLPGAWLYTIEPGSEYPGLFSLTFNSKMLNYYAVLGLDADEINRPMIDVALIGNSRWFSPMDSRVCILTDNQAEQVRVKISDKVSTLGKQLMVIGIIDSVVLDSIEELDGEMIAPWDRRGNAEATDHVMSDEAIIVPYRYFSADIILISFLIFAALLSATRFVHLLFSVMSVVAGFSTPLPLIITITFGFVVRIVLSHIFVRE